MVRSFAARVQSIVAGSPGDLVGALQGGEAEEVVRSAIREIERMCRAARSEAAIAGVALARANEELGNARAATLEASATAVGAIEMHRDDRAEAAIARQLDLESQLPTFERALAALSQRPVELASLLAALEGRRLELEADLAAYAHALAGVETDARHAHPPAG